jgi:hypothetical protein
VLACLGLAACAAPPARSPPPADSAAPSSALAADATPARAASAPRRVEVLDGDVVILEAVAEPGPIISTAPPPPGPSRPVTHPFVSATARSPAHESKLRDLLRASRSFDDFVARLEAAGFSVRDVPKE